METEIIIFDEATSMLDPKGTKEIIEMIKKLKNDYDKTIITITHNLEEAVFADRVIVLNDGKIVLDGTPKEVLKEKDTKKKSSKKTRFEKGSNKKVQSKVNELLAEENLAQTVLPNGAEIEPIIAEQPVSETEKVVVKETSGDVVENVEEKQKKQTRSKRPNRNTQKKPRTTKKTVKEVSET